ncbi:MAG: T9SS type A sorting domain-containing protein, partial [Bacteroidota bacterium]
DFNDCETTIEVTVDNITSTELPEAFSLWQLAPNPTRGQLRMTLQSEIAAPLQLTIFSATGQQVRQLRYDASNSYNEQIDLSDLSAGLYYLQAVQSNQVLTDKVMIVR